MRNRPKWIELGDWSDLLVILSVAAVCPFFLFPRPGWLLSGLLVPAAWICTYLRQGYFLPRTPLNVFLLPLLGLLAISLYTSSNLSISLSKVAGALLALFTFFAVVQLNRGRRRNQQSTALAVQVLAGILALASLFFTHWKERIPALAELARRIPYSFQEPPGLEFRINPNPVAGTMILVLPLLIALFAHSFPTGSSETQPKRFVPPGGLLFTGVAGILLLAVILLSQSYSAWIGLTAGSLVVVLGLSIPPDKRARPLESYAARAMVAIICAGFFLVTFPGLPGLFVDLQGRERIWQAALQGIQDFPLTGLGLSSFPHLSPILFPVVVEGAVLSDFASAHNLALQSALDLGLPGAILLTAIWVACLGNFFLVFMTGSDRLARGLALGCLGGLVAQLHYQVADSIPLGAKVGLLWWVVVGLGMSLTVNRTAAEATGRKRIEYANLLLLWVLFSLGAVIAAGVAPRAGVAVAVAGGGVLGWGALGWRSRKLLQT